MAAVYERDGAWLPVPRPVPLAQVIRGALLNALAYCDGNATEAARWLQVTPRVFAYALRRAGVTAARPASARRRRLRVA